MLSVTAGDLRAANQAGGAGEGPEVARAVDLEGSRSRTRFLLEIDAVPDVNIFALADPYRIVIDLADVRFALAADPGLAPFGLVKAFRYGEVAPGRGRIVIDLDGPATVDRFFHLPPVEGEPGHLVVDLVPSDPARFRAEVGSGTLRRLGRDTDAAAEPADIPDGAKPVIVLDPGHGGIDPGAEGASGAVEKTITLRFAKELREVLEADGRFDVRLTRNDDRFVALAERVRIARAFGADLFLSIHADTAPQSHVRGAAVYTMSERASDAAAAELAIRQNLVDALAGLDTGEPPDEVTDILVELARRETKGFSTYFADLLVGVLSRSVRMINNPHRSARFWVLRAHDLPSVLLEIGYLSNPQDEQLIKSALWREGAVRAVAEAIDVFFSQQLGDASSGVD